MRKRRNTVYVAKCLVNGKLYFGVTTLTLPARKSEHKCAAARGVKNKFYNAIRKYGFNSFEFSVIAICDTVELMMKIECEMIRIHNSIAVGYNTTAGGQGNPGVTRSPEHRAAVSRAQKARFQDPEQRRLASEYARRFLHERPNDAAEAVTARIETLRTQEMRASASEKQKAYLARNPEAPKLQAKKLRERHANDPALAVRISRGMGAKPIAAYRDGELYAVFNTLTEASRQLGVSSGNLASVLAGRRAHTGGFTFRRVDPPASAEPPTGSRERDSPALA